MQAIELESITERDLAIRLPMTKALNPGKSVRVVVMFEDDASVAAPVFRQDAISVLCENPLVLQDFVPLSRDEAHER